MDKFDILIKILEQSVEKNGEIPLTNRHLLNILKLVSQREIDLDFQLEMEYANIARWG